MPDSPCQGEFCTYCPNVTKDDDGNVYDDYDNLMTLPYRDHCNQWHNTDLFYVHEDFDDQLLDYVYGSLKLHNVYLIEIRAQYKSLITMHHAHDLILENVHFNKV